MSQYQEPSSHKHPNTKDASNAGLPDRELARLRQQIQQQQQIIMDLDRDLKKLRNELRLAVNTFNLTRNG